VHDTNKNTYFQGNTLYLFLRQEGVCSHNKFELSYCLFIIQIFIVIMKICHKLCFYLSIIIILFDTTKGANVGSIFSKKSPPTQACNMLIAIDERLYDVYNRNTKNLTLMVKDMVKGLNEVYQR
jgi:hypothetical protein